MTYTITFPRTYDPLLGWLSEITLTAPEGWVPRGYRVTTCKDCGEVTEPYSMTDQRVVHRATGWGMCWPARR